jgi:NADH:ubiquinone oxidoreductase subunit 6 (subunit J)
MAATTIIYAGAIIVTFLFVLMLAQQEGRADADWRSREPFLATAAGFVLLGALLYVLHQTYRNPQVADVLDRLDEVLGKAAEATSKGAAQEITQTLNGDQFFDDLLKIATALPQEPSLAAVENAIKVQEDRWFDYKLQPEDKRAEFLQEAVNKVRQQVDRARRTPGELRPDGSQPLSEFSGTPPGDAVPHDAHGNAPLKAENTAYLGQSLFTDYLLAVELAGTLLLVATIGAIAIASRRGGPIS